MNSRSINRIVFVLVIVGIVILWLKFRSEDVTLTNIREDQSNNILGEDQEFLMPEIKSKNESLMHRLLKADDVNLNLLKVIGPDLYGYNIIAAHKLSLLRDIPDTRSSLCMDIKYDESQFRSVSVIIPVYNEGYSVLMRTVYTVVHRSSKTWVKEIIIVDDFSPYHDTQLALRRLQKKFPRVIVHRLLSRQGLIKAKIAGEARATSEIIVFLDSHTEVNVGWLPPLIAEVMSSPLTKVALPVIDSIDSDTFEYTKNRVTIGGFNWGLYFTWLPNIKISEDSVLSVRSPTMSGGYFAMTKAMYKHFGGYDKEMKSWGGENLEMSFRIWQCGGQLNIVPCSRVGHIFRATRPYGEIGPGNNWLWNTLRMANVWMDEYIERFYKVRPEAKSVDFGHISERKEIRDTLNCQSFKWYLQELMPGMLREL